MRRQTTNNFKKSCCRVLSSTTRNGDTWCEGLFVAEPWGKRRGARTAPRPGSWGGSNARRKCSGGDHRRGVSPRKTGSRRFFRATSLSYLRAKTCGFYNVPRGSDDISFLSLFSRTPDPFRMVYTLVGFHPESIFLALTLPVWREDTERLFSRRARTHPGETRKSTREAGQRKN